MKSAQSNKRILTGIAAALACEFFYGYSFIFTKKVTNHVSAFTLLGWRFAAAFIILNLLVLLGFVRINLRGKQLTPLLLIALFDPLLYYFCETIGVQLTTASESGIIIAMIPIITLICTFFILREKPTRFQLIGIAVATIGVLLIAMVNGAKSSQNVLGYLLVFAAVVAYSLYSVFTRRTTQFTDIEKTWVMITFGALFFGSAALIENRQNLRALAELPWTQPDFLPAILFLGVGSSLLAFFFANFMISVLGSNRAASFSGLSTVISVISGVTVLHESLSTGQFAGMVLVLGGVYLANRSSAA